MAVTETDVRNAAPANTLEEVIERVTKVAEMMKPEEIESSDGPQAEWDHLTGMMVETRMLTWSNPEKQPNCLLTRSLPSDVIRVKSRTLIYYEKEEDAGPTSRQVTLAEVKEILTGSEGVFQGVTKDHTMYTVPLSTGPLGDPTFQLGVELINSPYVVCNMHITTCMGASAFDLIKGGRPWIPAVHSVGILLEPGQKDVAWPRNDEKYIIHFPEISEIWFYGSGYGGNALLGRKCYALRIASTMGWRDSWTARHMLILCPTDEKTGKQYHVTAAFPSACSKTNLTVLQLTIKGYKVETAGDDIAWMRLGPDSCLYAISPEADFFDVAPGTSRKTNPMAMEATRENTISTNMALIGDGDVWRGDCNAEALEYLVDWKGQDWTPTSGKKVAYPNDRFAAPVEQYPIICPDREAP